MCFRTLFNVMDWNGWICSPSEENIHLSLNGRDESANQPRKNADSQRELLRVKFSSFTEQRTYRSDCRTAPAILVWCPPEFPNVKTKPSAWYLKVGTNSIRIHSLALIDALVVSATVPWVASDFRPKLWGDFMTERCIICASSCVLVNAYAEQKSATDE